MKIWWTIASKHSSDQQNIEQDTSHIILYFQVLPQVNEKIFHMENLFKGIETSDMVAEFLKVDLFSWNLTISPFME